MAQISLLRQRITDPQFVTGYPAILRAPSGEVQSILWRITRSTAIRRGARLSGPLGGPKGLVGRDEPDRLRIMSKKD